MPHNVNYENYCKILFHVKQGVFLMMCSNPFYRYANGKISHVQLENGDMSGVPFLVDSV